MRKTWLVAAILVIAAAAAVGRPKSLTTDPLTSLPLIPATDPGKGLGNEPVRMPDGHVCRSTMQGDFYPLHDVKTEAAVAWYASHLNGFKKVQGYDSNRSQTAFFNADGTIVVFVTSDHGAKGENTNGYSVAYERYQPGISEKTIVSLTGRKIVCK